MVCLPVLGYTNTFITTTQVDTRVQSWVKCRSGAQPVVLPQLEWEAHILEYVGFLYRLTKYRRNSGQVGVVPPPSLPKEIPLLGPRFLPPSYLHLQKRQPTPIIQPQTAYLKPLNVVHPFYHPELDKCPQCDSTDVLWDGWTTSGHRELHGVQVEETVIGYQLICKPCQGRFTRTKGTAICEKGLFCFATTNPNFWKKWEHWRIPCKQILPFEQNKTHQNSQRTFPTSSNDVP